MGIRNYLIEGVSGTGKTSVCNELQRRGYHAIHGDRELAYQGDPETGTPTDGATHEHHIWHVDKVKALLTNQDEAVTFFCGGSRNFSQFIDLFDGVFVLDVDLDTLNRRLDERPENKWCGRKGSIIVASVLIATSSATSAFAAVHTRQPSIRKMELPRMLLAQENHVDGFGQTQFRHTRSTFSIPQLN